MSSLFDIGKSGLQSYQRALSVTGQNIANINTDGYKRREIRLEEISALQGGITEAPNRSGLGVRMDDIRRSFNEFLLNKARSATAYAATTDVYVNSLAQAENILLPGETGLNASMTEFFNSMQEVASSPADRTARTLFIQAGERMVESFQQTASLLTLEQQGLQQQVEEGLKVVNTLTAELAGLNQMIAASGGQSTNNALLDARDAVIDRVSGLIEVSTKLEPNGSATVTLGNSGQGPTLVKGTDQATIGVEEGDLRLSFVLAIGLSETPTSRVTNGSIRGFADAFDMLTQVQNQLDNLAFLIGNSLNEAHRKGLDLNGNFGGTLFNNVTVETNAHANNRGTTVAEMTIADAAVLPAEEITVTYLEETGLWTATRVNGDVVTAGRQGITLPGVELAFTGEPQDGDVFTVSPIRGQASSLSFAVRDPNLVAAASQQLVYANASNKGNAQIELQSKPIPPAAGIDNVQTILSNGISVIGATGFLRDEAVAVIPSGISTIELVSLARQPQLKFSMTSDELASLKSLSFEMAKAGGSSENLTFDLSYQSVNNNAGGWKDAASVAEMLNQGVLRGTNGIDLETNGNLKTFSMTELGLHASGKNGRLTIARNAMLDFSSGASLQFANNNAREGVVQLAQDTASNIQIITREGRHVAGSVLSSSEISQLITRENGFVDGAVYSSTYLNTSGASGYIGMGVDYKSGASAIQVSVTGATDTKTLAFNRLHGIDDSSSSPDGQSANAGSLSYTATIGGISKTISRSDVGENSSAGVAAAMAEAFRKDAPVASMSGAGHLLASTSITLSAGQQSTLTNNGRLSLTHNSVSYLLTNTSDGVVITGGHKDAVSLSYNDSTKTISTQIPDRPGDDETVTVKFEGQQYTISVKDGEALVSGGESGRVIAFFDSNYRLQLRSASGTLSGASISLLSDAELQGNTSAAIKFGLISGNAQPTTSLLSQSGSFTPTDFDVRVSGNQLIATHKSAGSTLTATASAESLARESIKLSDLPDEELIVLLTGAGARQITAVYDESPAAAPSLAPDLTVTLDDASAGKVKFIDKATGTVMAERTLDNDNKASALGFALTMNGAGQDGDGFEISNNAGGTGDGRNITAMFDLRNQSLSERMGGSFHDIFNRTVTDLGSAIQSGRLSAEAAAALKDASLEAEASYSGVNLDVEASNLIQQQQAYQASARILSTARELFQTLIEII